MWFRMRAMAARSLVVATGLVAGLVLVACGSDDPAPTSTPAEPTPVAVEEPTAASSPSPHVRDADAIRLAELARAALVRARDVVSDAVLPQIDIEPNGGTHIFRFTDAASSRGFEIVARDTTAPPGEWEVVLSGLSPPLGQRRAGIDLDALAVGPEAVVRVSAQPWPGCDLSLVLDGDDDPVWTVFCDESQELRFGTVDGRTGVLTLTGVPAASSSPAATPAPTAQALATSAPAGGASRVGAEVGAIAPDFTLPSATGDDVSLASYRGESNVVLIFYRGRLVNPLPSAAR